VKSMSKVKLLHGIERKHKMELAKFRLQITGEIDKLNGKYD